MTVAAECGGGPGTLPWCSNRGSGGSGYGGGGASPQSVAVPWEQIYLYNQVPLQENVSSEKRFFPSLSGKNTLRQKAVKLSCASTQANTSRREACDFQCL